MQQPTKKNSCCGPLCDRLGKPRFAESEISLRNLRIATGAMIDNSLSRADSDATRLTPKADIRNEYTPYFAVATAPSGATSRYPTPSSVNRIRGWVGSTSIFCRNLRTKIRR